MGEAGTGWNHPQPDPTRRLRADAPSHAPLQTSSKTLGRSPLGVASVGTRRWAAQASAYEHTHCWQSFVFRSQHLLASIRGPGGLWGTVPAPYAHVAPAGSCQSARLCWERGLRSRKPQRRCTLTLFTSSPSTCRVGTQPPLTDGETKAGMRHNPTRERGSGGAGPGPWESTP